MPRYAAGLCRGALLKSTIDGEVGVEVVYEWACVWTFVGGGAC